MAYIDPIIIQLPGLVPHYTKHPIFHDMFTAMIAAALIAIALNFAMAMLRKKTTDIEKMNRIMKETSLWRKQYTDAVRKRDKVAIEELKKRQAYVNKMTMEMQQQQMRPMLIYMMPSLLLWILVFPSIFGGTTAVSPIHIPWIMCNTQNVITDTQLDNNGNHKGPCTMPGEVYLFGWFLITNFAFSGIISKVTKTSMPNIM
ncbi:MAG: DUF106 domain-containing protein [Nitrososphaeraceae archaeon]|nr:DUF106 domain-containing protein [Nitrososphaeraceae archaeon]MBV9667220.1 DUF106 domain-containing protein [Nitrososphaeraceae archaeon]